MSFVDGAAGAVRSLRGQNDVLRSHGGGVRFVGSDLAQLLDTGFGVRSTNPMTCSSQGLTLVAVKPKTSDADYVDAAYDLLRSHASQAKVPVTLTGSYRFERVDPLFASVATPQGIRSDLLQHTAGVDANVGRINARVAEVWSHDNLHQVPSILRTDTGVTLSISWFRPAPSAQPQAAAVWWPVVVALTRSSQSGEARASQRRIRVASCRCRINSIPRRLSARIGTSLRLHVAYLLNHSFQDNRQPGCETSDFLRTRRSSSRLA